MLKMELFGSVVVTCGVPIKKNNQIICARNSVGSEYHTFNVRVMGSSPIERTNKVSCDLLGYGVIDTVSELS